MPGVRRGSAASPRQPQCTHIGSAGSSTSDHHHDLFPGGGFLRRLLISDLVRDAGSSVSDPALDVALFASVAVDLVPLRRGCSRSVCRRGWSSDVAAVWALSHPVVVLVPRTDDVRFEDRGFHGSRVFRHRGQAGDSDLLAEHLEDEGILCVRRQPVFEVAGVFEPEKS